MSIDSQIKNLGQWIASKRSGLSQTELAKKAGISQQQLSKIEAGSNSTISTLIKILLALGEKIELPVTFPNGVINDTDGIITDSGIDVTKTISTKLESTGFEFDSGKPFEYF